MPGTPRTASAIFRAKAVELEAHAVHPDRQADDRGRKPARSAVDLNERARFVAADERAAHQRLETHGQLLVLVRAHGERLLSGMKPRLGKVRHVTALRQGARAR